MAQTFCGLIARIFANFRAVTSLVLGLLFAGWVPLLAQNAPVQFYHLTTNEGLSQGFISAICQDRLGYLWIATLDGLNQYNGHEFKIYRNVPSTENSLSDNYIFSMIYSSQNQLWIGTQNGLNCLDLATGRFQGYWHDPRDPETLGGNRILLVSEDAQGQIWVCDDKHINRLDPLTGKVQRYSMDSILPKPGMSLSFIDMLMDREGQLWVLPQALPNTILRYVPREDTFVALSIQEDSLPAPSFRTIAQDRDGHLLLGNGNRVIKLDRERHIRIPFDEWHNDLQLQGFVRDLLVTPEGTLHIATMDGLAIYDRKSGAYTVYSHDPDDPSSLLFDQINTLFADQSGVIWCGTNSRGISTFSPLRSQFGLYTDRSSSKPPLPNAYIIAVREDRFHNLWIATSDNLICWINRGTHTLTTFPMERGILSLGEDGQGHIWAGGYGGLLASFGTDGETAWQIQSFEGMLPSTIRKIAADTKGDLILLTDRDGLFHLDIRNETVEPIFSDYTEEFSLAVVFHFDREGGLWVGGFDGLRHIDPVNGALTLFLHSPDDLSSLTNNNVITIHETRDGALWIGTSNGLNRFVSNEEGFIAYREANGLPNEFIYSIQEDEQGRLWMGTNKGLVVLDPQTKAIENYLVVDGLQSNEFNKNASFCCRDGEMIFGGVQGLNTFYPAQLQKNLSIPPIVISSIKVMGKEYPFNPYSPPAPILLNYMQNFVTVEFAALGYVQSMDNQFAYRMENLDLDWNYSGTVRSANYNLSPGTYIFRVKGSNGDGIWNEAGATATIEISPPYWMTWPFRILGGIFLLSLLYLFVFVRNRMIQARNRHLSELNTYLMEEMSKREATEKELRQSEERYRCVVDNAHDVVWRLNGQGELLFISASVKRIVGYEPEDLLGIGYRKYLAPKELKQIAQSLANRREGKLGKEGIILNLTFQRKDGTFFVGETMTTPLYDAEGHLQEIIGITRDITERHSLEEQLRQSQKMEAVGLLAGGIAHDFNNLLTGILGYSDMLMRKISEDSPFQHYLEEIHKAGKRAASLTSQLLAFSRKQILEAKVLKLNDLIQDMNKMLGRIIREDIHLQYFFGSALPCIKADPVQIEQIIMNLVLNARDAIPKKGEITIRTQTAQFDKITRFMHDEIKPGRYVELSVEDDGEGMSPEVMSQIFEPFFTTKEVGRGTGLGLSTVFGIVKQSGGAIQFQSTPGEGTRVSIYFPMVNEEPLPRIREAESSHTQGEEVIFLVEDEEFVRQMVQRILEEYGYTVLAAANYSEVEQQLAHDPGAIDLLLTDVILPQKNGREIAELVVARYPDTKVLYMSGHTEDEILRQGIFTSEVNFIHKPFSPLFLLQRIRTLLHPTRNF